MEGTAATFEIILPLIVMSIPIAISAYLLAKQKDRNVVAWVVLAFIPLVNIWCIAYFVGASNLRFEKN